MDEFLTSTSGSRPGRTLRRAALIFLGLIVLLSSGTAHAASRTWDGGCVGNASWSCPANWSGDVAPGPTDMAVFGAKSPGNPTVDSGYAGSIAAVRLNPGFVGTITMARSLTVSKAFSQRSGGFDAGDEDLALRSLMLSGGEFTASSGTTSVSAALKVSEGADFDANDGTVVFDGTSSTLTCNGVVFNRVAISNAVGTKTVGIGCDLPLGNDPPAESGGSIKLNGTFSGTGTLTTSGTLTLGSTGDLSGFSGLSAGTLSVGGAYDFGAYSTFRVEKAFTVAPGASFRAPSATASFAGNFKVSATAAFDANGGTISFDGAERSNLSCGNKAFSLVAFEHVAGTKVVGADCSLPLGSDPALGTAADASVKLDGGLSGTGTLTAHQTFVMTATSSLSGFNGFVTEAGLTMTRVSASFSSYANFVVDGNYSQTGGTVSAPPGAVVVGRFALNSGATFDAPASGTITFNDNFAVSPSATFEAKAGTVVFGGDADAAIGCGGASFNKVAFANVTGTKVVGSTCNLPLGDDPDVAGGGSITLNGALSGSGMLTTSGTLTLGDGSELTGFSGLDASALTVDGTHDFGAYGPFAVSGDFTLDDGAQFVAPAGSASFGGDFVSRPESNFIANGGTVKLVGVDQTVAGSNTFNNLTKVVASADTLAFEAGKTQVVQGALKLAGKDSESLLSLVSTSPGTPWLINRAGTAEVSFVSVTDSTNIGTPISATDSVSGGANSGWIVIGPAGYFVLAAATTTPTASAADNLTITAKDANGNTATSYTGAHNLTFGPVADSPSGAHATVTDSSGAAIEFGSTTAISFTEGVATVSGGKNGAMKLVKAGAASITVSDGSITNGAGLAVTVSPASAASLVLAAASTTPKAGEADNLTITAKDAYGNTATSYGGSRNLTFGPVADSPSGAHATVTNSSGTAVNFGSSTAITFTAGVASAASGKNGTMTLVKAGPASITVGDGTINGSGLAVTVAPTTATSLSLEAQDTTPEAGVADNLTITAKDTYGNTATSYTGSRNLTFGPVADSPSGAHATVTNSSGTAVNFGSTTAISFTEGVAAVSSGKNGVMNMVKPGSASITVSDGSITNGSGLAVTVSPGAASVFVLAAATTTPTAGAADNLTITAKDAYGNTATAYTGSHNLTFGPVADSPSGAKATVSNSSGTAVNFGSATAISFSAGVASVSSGKNGAMKLVKAGATSVTVAEGSITNGSGLAVTVSPASASAFALEAQDTTPTAGETDNLTITARDAYGNTATSYTGSHKLTFGPVADSPSGAHATVTNSSGTATNFGSSTSITFTAGVAAASGGKNGTMTLVEAGSASITVSEGSITNGSGLAVTVSPGSASRYAWTNPTSTGSLSSPCLFTCTGTSLGSSGNFKANVAVTDSLGNTVSDLGSLQFVSVTAGGGKISGGTLVIPSSGPAETTSQFTYTPSSGSAVTITAESLFGTEYPEATASMKR
jgi:hypothetical protein